MFIRSIRSIVLLPYLLCPVLPVLILRPLMILFGLKKTVDKWLNSFLIQGSRILLWAWGARLHIRGLEHVKNLSGRICFMGNHQGIADIPVLKTVIPRAFGFIIKAELRFVPVIGTCARAINSVFLNRKSPRQSIKAIAQGVEVIKNGTPLVIFPEGTRSKQSDRIGAMRRGAFQLAKRSEAKVVPFVLHNVSRLWEEKRPYRKEDVYVSFYPPILATEEGAADRVFNLIEEKWRQGAPVEA